METGFYTGRFQPFHLGHLSAVKQALKLVDKLYIGIGSSQYHHTPENPFAAEERKVCIEASLAEDGIEKKRFSLILVPDIHDNPKWPAHVIRLVPHFDRVFVGDDGLVKELFEAHTAIPVTIVKKEINICATNIRKKLKQKDGSWKKDVPPACAAYLEAIDAEKRMKEIEKLNVE